MKKLLVILLVALATCTAIEETFDDDVVLEKSWLKKLVPKITPKKIIPKIEPKKIIPKKIIPKIEPKKIIPKKIIPKVDPKKIIPKIDPKKIIPKVDPKKIIPKVDPKKIIPKVDPKKIIPKIDPKKIIPKVDPKKIIPKIDPKKLIAKIDPKKIIKNIPVLKKLPIKIDGLFKGKVGNAFKKLGDVVKKGIAWLKQNGLWDPIVDQLKEIGGGYANEICEKILPAEVCGPAVDFALNNVLKTEEEGEE
jgi:hypothetical protein